MAWYTSVDGAVLGPYTTEEISEQIQSSRLTFLTLVYSEEIGGWRCLSEVEAFRSSFSRPKQPKMPGDWIVLKSSGENAHVLGPYERDQIFEMLGAGELTYADSVWKPGEEGWTRLGDRDDFDRRSSLRPATSPVAAVVEFGQETSLIERIPASEILSNIARVDRTPRSAASDDRPEEAEGDDLTGHGLRKLALSVTLFCLLIPLGRFAQAQTLDVVSLKSGTPEALLVVHTDAPVGSVIRIRLSVAAGDVPGVENFQKTIEITRSAGELPTVELAPLKLQTGTYQVIAEVGGARKTTSFFSGVRDAKYEEERGKYLKQVAYYQAREKKALFYSARTMETLAKKLSSQFVKFQSEPQRWKEFLKKWRKEVSAAESDIASIRKEPVRAFPSQLEQFSTAVKALRSESTRLSSAVSQKRSVASEALTEPVSVLEKDFAKLKAESVKLSGIQ